MTTCGSAWCSPLLAGEDRQRDLWWLELVTLRDVSPDGKFILFEESGEGGGPGYSVYIRNVDGSPAIRLGEGGAQGFSRDGKSARPSFTRPGSVGSLPIPSDRAK